MQNAQEEHSAILLTFIKLQFVIEIFLLFIFEWPFYAGFTVNGIYAVVVFKYMINILYFPREIHTLYTAIVVKWTTDQSQDTNVSEEWKLLRIGMFTFL